MGFDPFTIGLGVALLGATGMQMAAAEDAEDASYEASQQQKKIREEQSAANAAQAAAERRRQIREERVKRARVMQSAQAAGVAGSSGEMGALGGMSTNLNSNIGANLGALQTANNISIFSQASADFMSQANALQQESQFWGQIGSLSMQGLSMYGVQKTKSPGFSGGQTSAPIDNRSI